MTTHRTIRPLTALLTLLLLALSLVILLPAAEASVPYGGDRIVGVVWHDLNCDGIRQDDEPLMPDVTVTLRYAGIRDAETREVVGAEIHPYAPDIQYTAGVEGDYAFSLAGWGEPLGEGQRAPVGILATTPSALQDGASPTSSRSATNISPPVSFPRPSRWATTRPATTT